MNSVHRSPITYHVGLILLALLLALAISARAHITEKERPWIEGMRNAAEKQQAELETLKQHVLAAETRRSAAELSLEATEKSYGELQVAHIELQSSLEQLTDWGNAQEREKHEAQLAKATAETSRLRWQIAAVATWVVIAGAMALKFYL